MSISRAGAVEVTPGKANVCIGRSNCFSAAEGARHLAVLEEGDGLWSTSQASRSSQAGTEDRREDMNRIEVAWVVSRSI